VRVEHNMSKLYLFALPIVLVSLGISQDMQHDMRGMHQAPLPTTNAAPDLLEELNNRTPIRLSDLEKEALAQNPTMKQADSLVKQSAAQARQAGYYPNPSAGYQGEQIRGGSYGGGEQGGFLQQTFVLGGKLGLRRAIYEGQKRSDEFGIAEQRFRVLSDVDQSFYSR
jgi:outer membrane protein, heavy metal efflux system